VEWFGWKGSKEELTEYLKELVKECLNYPEELKDKYKTLLEKPNLLDYDYMRDLVVTILSLTAHLYKPTKMHRAIYSDLVNKINYSYSTRAYSNLEDEKKRNVLLNWGTQVNNIFVLCGYKPIFEESSVSLNIELTKRYLPFWKRIKLMLQSRQIK